MKKLISILLTFALLFAITVPAFAAADTQAVSVSEKTENDGSLFNKMQKWIFLYSNKQSEK